jgi:uncharacterized radical SAM superfamily Fe-S cluster-containing enzyme
MKVFGFKTVSVYSPVSMEVGDKLLFYELKDLYDEVVAIAGNDSNRIYYTKCGYTITVERHQHPKSNISTHFQYEYTISVKSILDNIPDYDLD